jgi:hypothetical protein
MKMTDEDRQLIEIARKLESPRCREMLMAQAEAMYRAQEALKADYGLVGPDAALFNGAGLVPGPLYADRNPVPMGEVTI